MKTERLIALLMILGQRKRISASELAALFEVSVRTIYRDIDSLSVAGFPIQTHVGSNGGIQLLDNYQLDQQLFSLEDILAVCMGLQNLPTDVLALSPQMTYTLEKIKALIPEQQREHSLERLSAVTVDYTPWTNTGVVQQHFKQLKQAIETTTCVHFAYEDQQGTVSNRTVEPYQLALKETSWYLHGYCCEKASFRVFKLSRMSSLTISETSFPRRDFDEYRLGTRKWADRSFIQTILRIDASIKDHFVERFGIVPEKKIPGTTMYEVEFPLMQDEYSYQLLMRFGTKCECLAPEHVRQEVARRLKETLALYDD